MFSTIKGSFFGPGYHPVSGNRKFGIADSGGQKYFYIKGADRCTALFDNMLDPINYLMADELWESTVDNFNTVISDNHGVSTIETPIQKRVNWVKLKNRLKSLTPITHIDCE
ncbi:MAG: hypothetical protein ABJB16_14415 [Saprospiraceae bacterium]